MRERERERERAYSLLGVAAGAVAAAAELSEAPLSRSAAHGLSWCYRALGSSKLWPLS